MNSHLTIVAAALLVLGGSALAAQESAVGRSPDAAAAAALETSHETGTWQGTPWLSGGFGEDRRAEFLEQFRDDFNLKIELALPKGAYLGDVEVTIEDQGGRRVMDARSKGPWFLTRLPAGSYSVTASGFGQTFEQAVKVPQSGLQTVVFNQWDASRVPQ